MAPVPAAARVIVLLEVVPVIGHQLALSKEPSITAVAAAAEINWNTQMIESL